MLTIAEFVSRGLQFYLLIFYLAPMLGTVGYGLLGFAKSHVVFYVLAVQLGMDAYGIRVVSRNRSELRSMVNNILSIRLIFSIIAYLILIVVVLIFLNESPATKTLFLITGVNIFSTAFLLNWVYQGLEKMEVIAIRQVLISVINLIGILIFVNGPDDVIPAMIIMQAALMLNTIWMLYYYIKSFGGIKFEYDKEKWKKIIKISFSIGMSILVITAYNALDVNMLGFMLGEGNRQTGIYFFAHNVLLAIIIPSQIIQQAFFPQFSQKKSEFEMKKLFSVYSRITYLLGSYLGLMVFVFASELPELTGKDFADATGLIQYLSLTIFIIFINITFYSPLIAWGKEKQCLMANIFGLLVNAILNFILIPQYGMYGAAIATIFSELIVGVVLAYYFYREAKVLHLNKMLLYIIISLLTVAPGYLIKLYFDMPWLGMIVAVLLFIPLNLIFKTLTISELKKLRTKK